MLDAVTEESPQGDAVATGTSCGFARRSHGCPAKIGPIGHEPHHQGDMSLHAGSRSTLVDTS
ncbi:hypothetical protein CIK72_00300 [Brachybacterium alimentarium]|nr:hypothetical protein CIK71_01555 [Brachybacterium alimentarium]RCS83957.1 hypothetical protein CIK72_00300 [Brachybacterium alimentarium]